VSLDLAGHGESGLGRRAWTMPAFGEDVVAVAEKLGLEDVVLTGHSMGGDVIVEAARRMPDRVRGSGLGRRLPDSWTTSHRRGDREITCPLSS